jgi:hypothetical protein
MKKNILYLLMKSPHGISSINKVYRLLYMVEKIYDIFGYDPAHFEQYV